MIFCTNCQQGFVRPVHERWWCGAGMTCVSLLSGMVDGQADFESAIGLAVYQKAAELPTVLEAM